MKIKVLIGILVALIVLNVATIGGYVYFRFIRNGPPPRGWVHHDTRYRGRNHHPDLGLSPQQRDSLFSLLKKFSGETKVQRDSIHALEGATFNLLQQDPLPTDQINANLKTIFRLRREVSQNVIGKLVEAKSFMSRDQLEKFYNAIMQVRPTPPPPPDKPKTTSQPSH